MKQVLIERVLVVILFIMVITVFSFAERDTRTIVELHAKHAATAAKPTPRLAAADSNSFTSLKD